MRNVLIEIKKQAAPTQSAKLAAVRARYRDALARARVGSVNRSKWYASWYAAWREVRARPELTEASGNLGTKDFLQAIQHKMAPDWATRHLQDLLARERMGLPTEGIDWYANAFKALLDEDELHSYSGAKHPNVFPTSTFGASGQGKATGGNEGANRGGNNGNGHRRGNREKQDCACLTRHFWNPEDCYTLRYALRQETDHRIKPSKEKYDQIREELLKEK